MPTIRLFLIYGNTCTGQSTLGMKLEFEMGFKYISFGDLKTIEIANKTDIGKELERQIKKEEPIIPELGAALVIKNITDGNNIISGYPISKEELECLLRSCNCEIEGVITLNATEEVIYKRFFAKRTCPICQFPGREQEKCPKHDTLLVKKTDYNEKELSFRLRLYKERIESFLRSNVFDNYPKIAFDTSALSPQEVFDGARNFIVNL